MVWSNSKRRLSAFLHPPGPERLGHELHHAAVQQRDNKGVFKPADTVHALKRDLNLGKKLRSPDQSDDGSRSRYLPTKADMG